jgi:hypothetical protein
MWKDKLILLYFASNKTPHEDAGGLEWRKKLKTTAPKAE